MIDIKLENIEGILDGIKEKLGTLEDKSLEVLKNAVNSTAKEMRTMLYQKGIQLYDVKKSGFNKEIKLKSANKKTLTAVLSNTGELTPLIRFKTSQSKAIKSGQTPPEYITARVMKKNSMKPLVKDNDKAFIQKMPKSNHIGVFERTGTFRYAHVQVKRKHGFKTSPRKWKISKIKQLLSISMPQIIGNEEVVKEIIYGKSQEMFQENVEKEIKKILEKPVKK